MRAKPPDWSHRVETCVTRWNRLSRPESLREQVTVASQTLTEMVQLRNRLISVVEQLERDLSLEEARPK